jgi:hypothetical protein
LKTDFDFTNNKKLAEAGYTVEGKTIDGFKEGNKIAVNLQSKKALNTVVGHEITHVLEGTDLYTALQSTLKDYATSKGVYNSLLETAKENYKNVYKGLTEAEYNKKIEQEVTADLVGDYIFSDMDFVRNLSTKNPNVFQKVFNEIKYMLKVATAGSDAEKQLLKAKKIFEDVYRDTKRNTSGETQFAVAKNGKKSYNATKNNAPNLTEQVIRKHYDTKKTEFYVNDFDNYYRVKMGEELSYEIVETIKIDGNEDFIKSLEREWKNEFNTGREDIAPYNENIENSKGYSDSVDVETQGQQSWAEYFDELFEKFKSEGIDRGSYYTESGRNNSIAPPIKTPNKGVFFDDKTQFSVSDNQGNAVSLAMQKRLANTKAVDENGDLKVLYHGTPNGEFTIFDKSKGSVEGDFGSGFYFTDNKADVERNYEGGGPDFENKVSRRAEQIEYEEEIDYDEAVERAREELYVGSNKFEVYLNIENPAIVGETTLLSQDEYLEQYDESDFEDYDEYIAEVEQLVADDIENIVWEVENKVDVFRTNGLSEVLYEAYYEGGIGIAELKDKINDLYMENSNGELVGNEVTRQIIESLGYDGIIDSTVSSKFSNMGMSEDTTHYIVFKPNQIKSITNQNPTDNPDINLSLSDPNQDIAPIKNGVYSEDVMLDRPIAPEPQGKAWKRKILHRM